MMIDNIIVIEGGADTNIKEALRQWIESYASDLPIDFSFILSTNEQGIHVIQADERLDNDLFYFLVNYLDCAKGIEHDASVKGFTTGKKNDILKGRKLLVYISPADKEGDNVFAVTSDNENFKISFSGEITKIESNATFEPPMELKFDNPEIIKRDKQQEERNKTLTNVDKRFKVFSVISLILFVATHFILFALGNKELFQKSTVVLGGGIALWVFMDHVMLQYNKYYLRCLGIAILYAGYALALGDYYKNDAINIVALIALVFLTMQKPLRKIYLVFLKKEPKVDRSGTFGDLVYTIFLSLGTILLSILIMSRIR